MLSSLSIKNFAIIEALTIDFSTGMTVLSGETGAGKSIIIDALGLLLGGRGTSDYLRYGADLLTVEGLFIIDNNNVEVNELLEEFGLTVDLCQDNLLIRREINRQGKNLVRINGQLANVTLLKQLGKFLGDIHGQNEHQLLLDNKQHLSLLDQFGQDRIQDILIEYQATFEKFQKLRKEWLLANQVEADSQQHLNFLQFQLEELKKADFQAGEEETLLAESKRLQNIQAVENNLMLVQQAFSENDTNILNQLDFAMDHLAKIEEFDPDFPIFLEQVTDARFQLEEVARQLAYKSSQDSDGSETIDQVEARLSQMSQYKRKYGMTIDEIIQYQSKITTEIDQLVHRDQYLQKLEEQLIPVYEATLELAHQLKRLRQELSQDLKAQVEIELQDLYMKSSDFSVEFIDLGRDVELELSLTKSRPILQLNNRGMDQVEFFIKTNVGDTAKPLVKVASGGELSRFMLALKVVFSENTLAKVMVFDEIDTGVSGRVAFAIAQKMLQVADHHQVLAITHLPQVAAISDHQFYIEKKVEDQKTRTTITELSMEQRYEIIAQMMSGETLSAASIQLAKEMMNSLRNG